MKTLRWIGSKIYVLPMFDGEGSMETFFMKYEEIVEEPQRLLALDVALQDTPTRWWTAHKV